MIINCSAFKKVSFVAEYTKCQITACCLVSYSILDRIAIFTPGSKQSTMVTMTKALYICTK